MDPVFRLHGIPLAIISDRDHIFTSKFWCLLFQIAGTELRRVNQCLETYMRCFSIACLCRWSQWLSLAEYWYNSSFHSALGRTPFEVLYGHEPRHFGVDGVDSCAVPDLETWLQERDAMSQLLKWQVCRV